MAEMTAPSSELALAISFFQLCIVVKNKFHRAFFSVFTLNYASSLYVGICSLPLSNFLLDLVQCQLSN